MPSPETSVLIRTFNEEKHLPGLLEALASQSYRDFEIVVVDSGSLDRTREIASASADNLLRIDSGDFTYGYSLNVGVQAALGKYVAIVSAHTLPVSEGWLAALVAPLGDDHTAMAYGRQRGWSTSKFSEAQDLARTFGSRRKVLQPPHFFANNANSAIKKDLWQEHHFDETLPGQEDIEWAKYWMERGYRVVYDPEAAIHQIHEENWRQVRRRYYREAVATRWIGVKGRRHIVTDPLKELIYAGLDFTRAIWPAKDIGVEKGLLRLSREIALFRTNKAIGTVRGLLDGATMRDPIAREAMYFDRTSRSVVVHSSGKVSIEETGIPEVKPGDVLIRTAYNGVCGIDLEIYDGTLGYYQDGIATYPIVPGHEMSGRVVAAGFNVIHLSEGDPVVVESVQACGTCSECLRSNWRNCGNRAELGVMGRNGGYGQYVVVPGRFVHRLPATLDLKKGALCEPLAVVLKGLNRLSHNWPAEPASKCCAVVGTGSLGHFCARVLALRGHRVTVFDQDPRRLGYFQGAGIQTSEDMENLDEFDTLIEATGDPKVLDVVLNRSGAGASILLLGLPYSYGQFGFEKIVTFDKTIVGSAGSAARDFEEALGLLPELDLSQFTQCVLPLDQYREAWEYFRQRKHLKVILALDHDPQ